MESPHFTEAAAACGANGKRLLNDIEYMDPLSQQATCVAVATIAQEEFAKAFLLILVARGVIGWNRLVYRATRDHTCKQLLGIVMDYVQPRDEFERSMEWLKGHKKRVALLEAYKNTSDDDERQGIWARLEAFAESDNLLPSSVADSINILRHEKIRRWESSSWEWDEPPVYDDTARQVAAGKLDRAKPDALYVRLGRDGNVASSPLASKDRDASAAIEFAKRLGSLIDQLIEYPDSGGIEYGKIETAFRAVFAGAHS